MLVLLLFSSPHSFYTGFRSENWNGHSRSLVLCSVTHFCVVFEVCVWIIVRLEVVVDGLSAWPIIGTDNKHFYDYRYLHFQNWCADKIIQFWNALFGSNAACRISPLCGPEQSPPTAHLICWESQVGMGTEARYLICPGAKLWKTGVSISSDINGSAIATGEI